MARVRPTVLQRLRALARRAGAATLKLQMKLLATAVAGVAALTSILLICLAAGAVSHFLQASDAAVAGVIVALIAVLVFVGAFVGRRFTQFVTDREEAVDAAVEGAERHEENVAQALAGGVPGRLAIAEPADPAGRLSEAKAPGALSPARPRDRRPT